MSPLLPLLLFLLVSYLTLSTSLTIPILHASSSPFQTPLPSLLSHDSSRLLYLSSLATAKRSFVPLAPGRTLLQIPNYIVRSSLGSPPQPLLAALDTSNDASFFPCSGCSGCPPSTPSFTFSHSNSYRPLPCSSSQCKLLRNPLCPAASISCSYNFTYGSSSIQATLAQDSFALAQDVLPTFTFGCLQQVTGNSVPPQGLLGLGRGSLSFLSQSNSLYGSVFSYCLPSYKSVNFSGTLRLGPVGQPKRIKTTPLLSNPHRSSLYYVNMIGVRVGRHVVDIPPSSLAFDPATGAGTIIDSGTMFTRLVAPAYVAVRDEFRKRVRGAVGPVKSLGGFDTCYSGVITGPTISFMFSGMNVTLPLENMLIHSSAGPLTCLAMAAAPVNVNAVLNVIANMQQQNHRVLFDVPNGRVGFARETCT